MQILMYANRNIRDRKAAGKIASAVQYEGAFSMPTSALGWEQNDNTLSKGVKKHHSCPHLQTS